jgi:hypothetical protein
MTVEDFFDTTRHPLVLDKRDLTREQFLVSRLVTGNKPLLLLNVSCGKSSPFPSRHVFQRAILRRWSGEFECLDLCKVKAGRVFDLLGLLDRAKSLITTDTAVLHVAAASQVPVIALVHNATFRATAPRCNCVLKMTYAEAVGGMASVHHTIERLAS